MIKYSESELTDLLPSSIKEDTDIQAISYALRMAVQKLITFSKRTRLSGDIDQISEDILDLMAVELQTQYYDRSLDLETKRNLVKNTMQWHAKAGTPSAVEELAKVVFGVGEVVEWFDFDPGEGEIVPGQFDIETNAVMTAQMAEDFTKIIRKVKNASSHLRRVLIRRSIPQYTGVKSGLVQSSRIAIDHSYQKSQEGHTGQYVVSGLVQRPHQTIRNDVQLKAEQGSAQLTSTIMMVSGRAAIYSNNMYAGSSAAPTTRKISR